ncbi:Hypothetical_protein [Hexamita inflata]|uniref:Hypothetical_protein n=1 Tax=Hexamita inflata TaxID=28002 RepID=A0AA86PUR0_9EUKA|nr:Hypothetical protein HINF_LOCUS34325 [Hexamita inflata]
MILSILTLQASCLEDSAMDATSYYIALEFHNIDACKNQTFAVKLLLKDDKEKEYVFIRLVNTSQPLTGIFSCDFYVGEECVLSAINISHAEIFVEGEDEDYDKIGKEEIEIMKQKYEKMYAEQLKKEEEEKEKNEEAYEVPIGGETQDGKDKEAQKKMKEIMDKYRGLGDDKNGTKQITNLVINETVK